MPRRLRAILLTPLLVLGFVLSAAPPAPAAAPLGVTFGEDPHEDVPFALTVSGRVDEPTTLSLWLDDAGGSCAYGNGTFSSYDGVDGAFTLTKSIVVREPGAMQLCVAVDRTTLGERWPVTVRPAAGDIAIAAPTVAAPGTPFRFTVTGTSELVQQVFVKGVTQGDCDPYYSHVFRWGELLRDTAVGSFAFDGVAQYGHDGRLLLCAYLQESEHDLRSVAMARASVLISDACPSARRDVARAAAALRTASRRAVAAPRSRRLRRLVSIRRSVLAAARQAEREACPKPEPAP